MARRRVIYAPEAQQGLFGLYGYIAERADPERARAYAARIEACCDGLGNFPERGSARDDLLPGLRVIGFERRVTIAFHVTPEFVVIDRILYGGRDLDTSFDDG